MAPEDLRIALVTGNYNYVRDGANQALNRLVDFLLRQGCKVRIYSPTVAEPAFPPTGDLVSLPSIAAPGRPEYRIPLGLTRAVRKDLEEFAPNIVHIASPDISSHRAVSWARARKIPAVASVHTRFETYLAYYHLELLEPTVRAALRRLYLRCDALLVPAESTAAVLRAQRMNRNISIWSRGVDRAQFNPERRSLEWRRSLGIGDGELVVAFLGRIVMEKGLDVFAAVHEELKAAGVAHRVLVIGEGPARAWFEKELPDGIFVGHQEKDDLARALASADIFLNPSITETFGNVTLEAMACASPWSPRPPLAQPTSSAMARRAPWPSRATFPPLPQAIAAYAADPELRARHGDAGLAFAKTQDWDVINGAVLETYARAIERRERLNRMQG